MKKSIFYVSTAVFLILLYGIFFIDTEKFVQNKAALCLYIGSIILTAIIAAVSIPKN